MQKQISTQNRMYTAVALVAAISGISPALLRATDDSHLSLSRDSSTTSLSSVGIEAGARRGHISDAVGLARLCISATYADKYTPERYTHALSALREAGVDLRDIYNPSGILWLESACCSKFTIHEKVQRFIVGALGMYAHALAQGASAESDAVPLAYVRNHLPDEYPLPVQRMSAAVLNYMPFVVIEKLITFQRRVFGAACCVAPGMVAEFWKAVGDLDLATVSAMVKKLARSSSQLYRDMYTTIVDYQMIRLQQYQEAVSHVGGSAGILCEDEVMENANLIGDDKFAAGASGCETQVMENANLIGEEELAL